MDCVNDDIICKKEVNIHDTTTDRDKCKKTYSADRN